jgi:hypothetical protein
MLVAWAIAVIIVGALLLIILSVRFFFSSPQKGKEVIEIAAITEQQHSNVSLVPIVLHTPSPDLMTSPNLSQSGLSSPSSKGDAESGEWWVKALHAGHYSIPQHATRPPLPSRSVTPMVINRRPAPATENQLLVQFKVLLDSGFGSSCFMQYLVTNMCAENLLFHQAVKHAMRDPANLSFDEFNHIHAQFIKDDSPTMISLSADMKSAMEEEFRMLNETKEIPGELVQLLRLANDESVQGMAHELFPRFMQDPISQGWRDRLALYEQQAEQQKQKHSSGTSLQVPVV